MTRPPWVKLSPELSLSQDGQYAVYAYVGMWRCAFWDGVGWSELFVGRPAESLLEAKLRANRHRWTRPLKVSA